MRVLIQRVKQARVTVASQIFGEIGPGLLLLIGIALSDDEIILKKMAEKVVNLRIFDDGQGKVNLSALDCGADILVVSQFTLYADAKNGRRPSFTQAAKPEQAEPLIQQWVSVLKQLGIATVATGKFRADMLVELANDGPVTLMLDSDSL